MFGELRKTIPLGMDIHFWRTTSKAEVGFVIDTGSGVVGLEVKAGTLGRPSIPRSARSFIEAYRPTHFLIVSTGHFDQERLGATEVSWITPDEVASTMKQIV